MVYHAGSLLLSPISERLCGPVNDILVCRDLRSPLGAVYLVLLVRNRECAKSILRLPERPHEPLYSEGEPCFLHFMQNEMLGIVFPYREERRLISFAPGQLTTPFLLEKACSDLVMACLSSTLPYPLLYLALSQKCVHLMKDGSIYLTPTLDLTELDDKKGERVCALECARLLVELLERTAWRKRQLKSCELIRKKLSKCAYSGFPELYRDIKATALPERKPRLLDGLKGRWFRTGDGAFRVLLLLCTVSMALALVFLISQLVFGDVPFLRFFQRAFEVIGTERLR